jgi:tRNA pseudouridine55 synthase
MAAVHEKKLPTPFSGVLVVDKPQGPTSHDIVAEARRALGTRRVGHTGTLDPLATGVLPLVIGHATRLSQFLTGASKGYDAVVRLGVATDTYDAEGEPVGPAAADEAVCAISDAAIAAVTAQFAGRFDQTPPPYSAKKIGGVRAYALARRRVEVHAAPVAVTVHELTVTGRHGARVALRVEASAGFYVRSLAHDIGRRLGCGAHLESLRRFRSGPFTLDQAVTIDTLRSGGEAAVGRLVAMESLLPELPAFELSEAGTRRACHGNALGPSDGRPRAGAIAPEGALSRLFSADGRLVALARTTPGGSLQPVVVLS